MPIFLFVIIYKILLKVLLTFLFVSSFVYGAELSEKIKKDRCYKVAKARGFIRKVNSKRLERLKHNYPTYPIESSVTKDSVESSEVIWYWNFGGLRDQLNHPGDQTECFKKVWSDAHKDLKKVLKEKVEESCVEVDVTNKSYFIENNLNGDSNQVLKEVSFNYNLSGLASIRSKEKPQESPGYLEAGFNYISE
ncbi:MAG: hypothetical protein CME61_00780, partial [Halobacteriovoraceae bacterium]|nr:hypothetical protein [Halobacteriovoraceae bacterium]